MAIRMLAQSPSVGQLPALSDTIESNWRHQLPTLSADGVVLRQLRASDAASLFLMLTTEEVERFITPPPTTLAGFQQFVAWALDRQQQGKVVFFAVVPRGMDTPVGLFQMRALDSGFATAEWGFALGSPYWGTGLFPAGAGLTQQFAFDVVGVRRLEARSMVENARGNAALRKVGGVVEGVLRQAFEKHGRRYDQYLWSILADEWRAAGGVLVRSAGFPTHASAEATSVALRDDASGSALWLASRAPIVVRH